MSQHFVTKTHIQTKNDQTRQNLPTALPTTAYAQDAHYEQLQLKYASYLLCSI